MAEKHERPDMSPSSLPPGGAMTIAANDDGRGNFTLGVRYERDAEGVLWRTRVGMAGPIGPRERVTEDS